jgi:hypothetical protein
MATTIPLHLEIRFRIATLREGESSLREFYEWFVPATWQVERTGEEEAIRLTHTITHLFSEFSAGDLTASEVTDGLLALAVD